ncbi:MAG: domain family protein [Candidatus Solibacter sp.]|jgi:toxin-antitoxin system PIN domain toxin|nr:domain family protein [Candidatus Solibacter sp.]
MSIALLDVNVLVALMDPTHIHHESAHRWLGVNRRRGWATCPITINGCIRILASPAYGTAIANVAEITSLLEIACSTPDHHFWPDSVSLLDKSLFRPSMLAGHRTITDVYLLGLAVRNHGRLATFDQSISLRAVHDATPGNLALISRA